MDSSKLAVFLVFLLPFLAHDAIAGTYKYIVDNSTTSIASDSQADICTWALPKMVAGGYASSSPQAPTCNGAPNNFVYSSSSWEGVTVEFHYINSNGAQQTAWMVEKTAAPPPPVCPTTAPNYSGGIWTQGSPVNICRSGCTFTVVQATETGTSSDGLWKGYTGEWSPTGSSCTEADKPTTNPTGTSAGPAGGGATDASMKELHEHLDAANTAAAAQREGLKTAVNAVKSAVDGTTGAVNAVKTSVDAVKSEISSATNFLGLAIDETTAAVVASKDAVVSALSDSIAAANANASQINATIAATSTNIIDAVTAGAASTVASSNAMSTALKSAVESGAASTVAAIGAMGTTLNNTIGAGTGAIVGAIGAGKDATVAGLTAVGNAVTDLFNYTKGKGDAEDAAWNPLATEGAAVTGPNQSLTNVQTSVAGLLDYTGGSGGSCPPPYALNVGGRSYSVPFDGFCQLASVLGVLVMLTAGFVSMRIVAGGL